MANIQFLKQLFQAHLNDLISVRPDIQEAIFVCPICFCNFNEADIDNKKLTDGHVWPEYIRARSQVAASQHVLLCNRCNHTAGSRGDMQMQLMEKVREGNDKGELHGERRVQFFLDPNDKPIEITASVQVKCEEEISITGNWKQSNPRERKRFEALVDQTHPFSVIIPPHRELQPDLIRVGWITSAYLFAFFALGYRYVFHRSVTAIREYILRSFSKQFDEQPEKPSSGDFGIMEYQKQFFPDPEIVLAVPTDDKTFVHLEVNFLKYQVALPFHYVPSVLTELMYLSIPDFKEQLSEATKTSGYFYLPIVSTKQKNHECIYDYLMGKPIPK